MLRKNRQKLQIEELKKLERSEEAISKSSSIKCEQQGDGLELIIFDQDILPALLSNVVSAIM